MLPLNDTQKYDLVIDKDNSLKRVSIKTTQGLNKSNKYYIVQLKNSGGASGVGKIRNFDNTTSDILFIVTKEGIMYEIPTTEINVGTCLTLSEE